MNKDKHHIQELITEKNEYLCFIYAMGLKEVFDKFSERKTFSSPKEYEDFCRKLRKEVI